jgi:hypothetical protein
LGTAPRSLCLLSADTENPSFRRDQLTPVADPVLWNILRHNVIPPQGTYTVLGQRLMIGTIHDEWNVYKFKGDKLIGNLFVKLLHGRYRFPHTWIDCLVQCLLSNRSLTAISQGKGLDEFVASKLTNEKAWADVFEVTLFFTARTLKLIGRCILD